MRGQNPVFDWFWEALWGFEKSVFFNKTCKNRVFLQKHRFTRLFFNVVKNGMFLWLASILNPYKWHVKTCKNMQNTREWGVYIHFIIKMAIFGLWARGVWPGGGWPGGGLAKGVKNSLVNRGFFVKIGQFWQIHVWEGWNPGNMNL